MPDEGGAETIKRHKEDRAERRDRLQRLEDLLNSGTLTSDERRALLAGPEVNHFSLSGGRYTIHK